MYIDEIKYMIVDTVDKAATLLEECKKKRIHLRSIILMDDESETVIDLAKETGVSVKSFVEVQLLGKFSLKEFKVSFYKEIRYESGSSCRQLCLLFILSKPVLHYYASLFRNSLE